MRFLITVASLLALVHAGQRDKASRPCVIDRDLQTVNMNRFPKLRGYSDKIFVHNYSDQLTKHQACASYCAHQTTEYSYFVVDNVNDECKCAMRVKKLRVGTTTAVSVGALNTKSSKFLKKKANRARVSYTKCSASHLTRSTDGSTDIILGMEGGDRFPEELDLAANEVTLFVFGGIINTDERRDDYHIVYSCSSASECTVSIVPAIPTPLMAQLYTLATAGVAAYREDLTNNEEVPAITVSPRKVAWFGVSFDWTKDEDDHPGMSDGDHIRMIKSPDDVPCPDAGLTGKARLQMVTAVSWWKAIAYHAGEDKVAYLYEINNSPNVVRSADLTTTDGGNLDMYNYVIWKAKTFGVHSPVYQIYNIRDLQNHDGCTYLLQYLDD